MIIYSYFLLASIVAPPRQAKPPPIKAANSIGPPKSVAIPKPAVAPILAAPITSKTCCSTYNSSTRYFTDYFFLIHNTRYLKFTIKKLVTID